MRRRDLPAASSIMTTFAVAAMALSPTPLPSDPDAMVRQAASAVTLALTEGEVHRQTVRMPLSDAMYAEKEEGFVADRALGWQGGPTETLRYLSPMAGRLLQEVRTAENTGGLPAKITEQVLLDFDGSSLLTAESPAGPLYDVQALLQANTDDYYLKTVKAIEEQFSDTPGKSPRLFLLVNPAWRDRGSWGMLGGKKAKELVLNRYETTFAMDQFIVRGQQVSLVKSWPLDWTVYLNAANGDAASEPIGTFAERPKYQEIDVLLRS